MIKDDALQQPIPTAWRQAFRDVVSAFIAGDYRLDRGVLGVESIDSDTANQIREYLSDYGATLTALPEGTWESSVCMWMGSHWEALVDLWTKAEGRSDLVLHARVFDESAGFLVKIHLVYVP